MDDVPGKLGPFLWPPPQEAHQEKNDGAASPFRPPPGSDASNTVPLPSPVQNSAPDAPTIDSTPPKKRIDEKNDAAPSPFRPPPGSDASKTAPLPSPIQRRHDSCRAANSRAMRTVTDLTRLRLRRRIQKIYQMATDVVDGYGNEYYNKHLKPLPQETIDKIMLLYHNRINAVALKLASLLRKRSSGTLKMPVLTGMNCQIPAKNPRNTILMTSSSIRTQRTRVKTMMMRRRILQESAATMMTQTCMGTI